MKEFKIEQEKKNGYNFFPELP